jgi:hypothetical protein
MAAVPNLPSAVNLGVQKWEAADTTTTKTIFTAGASGSKVTGIWTASSDTANKIHQLYLQRGGVDYQLTSALLPLNGGFDSNGLLASVNMMTLMIGLPVDNDGQTYMLLKSGDVIRGAMTTTVTAARAVTTYIVGADF